MPSYWYADNADNLMPDTVQELKKEKNGQLIQMMYFSNIWYMIALNHDKTILFSEADKSDQFAPKSWSLLCHDASTKSSYSDNPCQTKDILCQIGFKN